MFSWYKYLIVNLVFFPSRFLEWGSFPDCAFGSGELKCHNEMTTMSSPLAFLRQSFWSESYLHFYLFDLWFRVQINSHGHVGSFFLILLAAVVVQADVTRFTVRIISRSGLSYLL